MSEKTSMFELLNERLSEEEIIKITTSYDNKFNELERENILLKDQLQQKENIIKEVKEYIEKEYVQVKNKEYNLSWNNLEYIIKELLEILDKGE